MILDCYRLAKYYGINPRVFLEMPFSEVSRHLSWTDRLIERANIEASIGDGG